MGFKFPKLGDKIMVFGGEPLDQDTDDLCQLLYDLSTLGLPIWLFTRYDIDEVPPVIKQYCDYIKTGRYLSRYRVSDYTSEGIPLATSNQKVHKIDKEQYRQQSEADMKNVVNLDVERLR